MMKLTMTKALTVVMLGAAILSAQTNEQNDNSGSTTGKRCKMARQHGCDSSSFSKKNKDCEMTVTKVDKSAKKLAPQSTCPIMGGTINKSLYADYDGKRVYFCCGGCIPAFNKEPVKYLKKLDETGQQPEIIADKTKSEKKPQPAKMDMKHMNHGDM